MIASLLFACGGDDIADGSADKDGDGVLADDDDGTHAVGGVALPGFAAWTDVHDVQIIDGNNRVEIWARNARWELIGRIVLELEDFGTRIVVSSEYADGGFAVEVLADMDSESYNVIYQTLEDEELTSRAAAIEDLLYQGAGPQGKWLACAASAALVAPACLGPWAALVCIPSTFIAGCKCTKAALDLPNEKAGLCENV